ncbi:CotH kinase family protein [Pseudarthrobacter sp. AB1]|uniref:CotH kinase family protein n=1 Tax=Pseudarthrobacter sp. AB1 TaxID=2138309 RepID=UPI00186B7F5E|nr:CotH kinase family protein [Pseudarthrobacter sp. AB1]MBE4718681.1 spore coat protein CotH [Pseudarthrobacter sp. AB1]
MTQSSFFKKIRTKATTVTVTAGVLALMLSGCSGPATTDSTQTGQMQSSVTGTSGTETSLAGTVDLFDTATSHEISIEWDEADYAAMIADYENDSDKSWISADITIDGTLIENVGVRLKGNSTLRTLGGTESGPPAGAGGGIRPGEVADGGPPAGFTQDDSNVISADDPASLPLLIRFDKYVDDADYEGLTELALRPSTPVINEALALSITAATDQITQRYTYTTYSVNGSPTQTRLLLENPDEEYAENLDNGNNVVFKADSESSFTYQGDDLETYEEQFKQLNKTDSQDATPIVSFLKWLDDADDATFDAELSTWVDVDSFAKYAATQNLLANADDMTGAGQNYYLSYDLTTKKITVISWDLNEALINNATASPDTVLTMGGGQGAAAGTNSTTFKSRFLASTVYKGLYDSAYQELYSKVFVDGTAQALLASVTSSIPASDALTSSTIAESSAIVGTFLQQRAETLEETLRI